MPFQESQMEVEAFGEYQGYRCRRSDASSSETTVLPLLLHVMLPPSTRLSAPLHRRWDGSTTAISTYKEDRRD
jgi:hypothetical protein